MPLLDHTNEPRERGMPRSLIIQLLVLCILFGGVGYIYLQSLTRARYATGTTMGFHDQGLSVVHHGTAKYPEGREFLDYLVFELVQQTEPNLQITATPKTGLLFQEPAYRVRAADGSHRPLPIDPQKPGGEVFVVDEEGQIRPTGLSVLMEDWLRYFNRYREIGDGNLSADSLREFLENDEEHAAGDEEVFPDPKNS